MGRTKKGAIDNAELENFITNITERFEGQRNTLNFMRKLGNVDATEVILHAAEKEVSFVVDRLAALEKMATAEAPLSEATVTYMKEFAQNISNQVTEDITFNGFDSSALKKELDEKVEGFLKERIHCCSTANSNHLSH